MEKKKRGQIRKELIEQRRKTAVNLILQGIHISEIAKKFNVTRRTIEKDVFAYKKQIAKGFEKIRPKIRLAEYEEASRQRLARIWKILSDSNSKKRDMLHAIKLLQREEELKIKRDQLIGILPKEEVANVNFNQLNMNNLESIKIEFDELPQKKVIEIESDKKLDNND